MVAKKKKEYLSNKDLLRELNDYKVTGIISNTLGGYFIQLVTKLSNKGNFCGYTWKDEMCHDALENCCRYIHNFNAEISKNAFAYFTRTIINAFVRRIKEEQKQLYTRYKLIENSNIQENKEFDQNYYKGDFIDKFELGLANKKAKHQKKHTFCNNTLEIELDEW